MSGPVETVPFGSSFAENMQAYSAALKQAKRDHAELQREIKKSAIAAKQITPDMVARLERSEARISTLKVQAKDQKNLEREQIQRQKKFSRDHSPEKIWSQQESSIKSLRRLSQLNFVRDAISGQVNYGDIALFLSDDKTSAKIQRAVKPILGDKITKTMGAFLSIAGGPAGFLINAGLEAVMASWKESNAHQQDAANVATRFAQGRASAGLTKFARRGNEGKFKTIFDELESARGERFAKAASFLASGGKSDFSDSFSIIFERLSEDTVNKLGRKLNASESQIAAEDALAELIERYFSKGGQQEIVIDDITEAIKKAPTKLDERQASFLTQQLAEQQASRDTIFGKYGRDIFAKAPKMVEASLAETYPDELSSQGSIYGGVKTPFAPAMMYQPEIAADPPVANRDDSHLLAKYAPKNDSKLVEKYARGDTLDAELRERDRMLTRVD